LNETIIPDDEMELNLEWNPDWVSKMPLKTQKFLSRFKSPHEEVKSHEIAQELLDKRKEDYGDNDWDNVIKADERVNNIPSAAEKYQLGFNPFHEDSKYVLDGESEEAFKQLAFATRLNQDQANAWLNFINESEYRRYANQQQREDQRRKECEKHLKADFGDAYNEYMNLAKVGKEEVLPAMMGMTADQADEYFRNKPELAYDPYIIKALINLGRFKGGNARPASGHISKTDAAIQYNQAMSDKQFLDLLGSANHPEHGKALDYAKSLLMKTLGEGKNL
jgi:hypothetical protein